MQTLDEESLVRSIAAGDRAAFRALYELYSSQVYNTALSYVRNAEDAAEIVQDVFIEAYESAATFEGRAALRTWLYRITVNRSLDRLRYLKRKKRAASLVSLFRPSGELEHDVAHFDHPGIEIERKEDAALLFSALAQLPDTQRSAYILAHVEGLSMKEVADVLQITPKAVESLLSRAKANLRKILTKLRIGPKDS